MKILTVTVFTLTILSSSVFAGYQEINCDSIRGSNHSLKLFVVNQELKQVRVAGPGRHIVLVPRKIIGQSIPNSTLYTIIGNTSFLEVENKVLENNGGLVKLSGDEFSCF